MFSKVTSYIKKYKFHNKHSFHIVTPSPWPAQISVGALLMAIGGAMYMHFYTYGGYVLLFGTSFTVIIMLLWFRDIVREGTYLGFHTKRVQRGLRLGMLLFIISEVMFFFSFFWAFFHSSLSPDISLGSVWPPIGINVLIPSHIPLMNTVILVVSGITVTCSHLNVIYPNIVRALDSLLCTIILAVQFTAFQVYEYFIASFFISDGIYGSTFYMTTGFHGFHVIIGTLFLMVCAYRLVKAHFVPYHHFGFEAAIWYWHFVDVVWLFVYLTIYCWGSGYNWF